MLLLTTWVKGQYIDKIGNYKFLENKGQWADELAFKGTIPNGDLFFFEDGIGYLLNEPGELGEDTTHSIHLLEEKTVAFHAMKLRFVGGNKLNWQAIDKSSAYYNFLYGSDQSKWHTELRTSQQLFSKNIYEGIDIRLILHDKTGFKYEFLVGPHVDTKQIELNFEGAEKVKVIDEALHITTSIGELIESPPYVYQLVDSVQVKIACRFSVKRGKVFFRIGKYDESLPLVIDPKLIFSTSAGSRADYWGNTACNDNEGSLYTGGTVFSHNGQGFPTPTGFPTTTGAFQQTYQGGGTDMGIMKFDSSGTSLLYSTYLGGSDSEIPTSLVVDEATKELLILGTTGSANFPIPNPATTFDAVFSGGAPVLQADLVGGYEFANGTDIVVTRLSTDGKSIVNATYLGGTGTDGINRKSDGLVFNYGDQLRGDIFLDKQGAVYIASVTSAPLSPLDTFPSVGGFSPTYLGGASDGVLVKMSADLSTVIWSNHIGSKGIDACYSVRIDNAQNVLVTGGTSDTITAIMSLGGAKSLPMGSADGYVMKVSSDGTTPLAGTYVGTDFFDQTYFVDLDVDESVYVLGQTQGRIPVVSTYGQVYGNPNNGVFIMKFSADLSTELLSTTIGDITPTQITSNISPTAFLVNECGNIFISGWGGLINSHWYGYNGDFIYRMPVTANAYRTTTDNDDFYLMVLYKNAEYLLYGSYFGGGASREHVDGGTSRFDKAGTIYQSVCANCGGNRDFPTFPDDGNPFTYPMRSKSRNCNNGVFKFDLANLEAIIDGPECVKSGKNTYFENKSTGGVDFIWDFGDGSPNVVTEKPVAVSHSYKQRGTYTIQLIATDLVTCVGKDTTYLDVVVITPIKAPKDTTICPLKSVTLTVVGAEFPQWSPANTLFCTECFTTIASPSDTTVYIVKDSVFAGCAVTDTVVVNVKPKPIPLMKITTTDYRCYNEPITFTGAVGENECECCLPVTDWLWDFGDGTTSTELKPTHEYSAEGTYEVILRGLNYDTVKTFHPIELYPLDSCLKNIYIPNAFTPNGDLVNDILYVRGINIDKLEFRLFNRWGEEVFFTDRLSHGWDAFYKGKKQTQQVFVFKCTVVFYDGEERKFEGNVTLLE